MPTYQYKSIVKKTNHTGKLNEYYDQDIKEHEKITQHLQRLLYIMIHRSGDFKNKRDWKEFHEILLEEVKGTTSTIHNWTPSVLDIFGRVLEQNLKTYNGVPARYSVKQIASINKAIDQFVGAYNIMIKPVPELTLEECQINMELAPQSNDPLAKLKNFIEQ